MWVAACVSNHKKGVPCISLAAASGVCGVRVRCMGLACRVALIVGVLRLNFRFAYAVESNSCGCLFCKWCWLTDVWDGCGYSSRVCAFAFLGGARPLQLSLPHPPVSHPCSPSHRGLP